MAIRRESVDVSVTGAAQGARDLDRLGRAADDLGDELKGAGRDASVLDKEIDRLQRTSADLNREFSRTGDKGLLKQLKDVKRDLAPLTAVRKELDKIAASQEQARKSQLKAMLTPVGGGGGRGGVRASVGGLSLPANPTLLAGVGLGVAGLSLPILAGAGGAILAGGAGLGVGAGIAGAAKSDPRIAPAFSSAVGDESKRWQAASKAFADPTLAAIKQIKAAFDDVDLEGILKNAAAFVDPLARGVAGLVRGLGDGLDALMENAGPVVEVLSSELPAIGEAFQLMFEEIGAGSEGGAEALEDILHVTEDIIVGTGRIIHVFEDIYAAGVKLRTALPGDFWQDDEDAVHGFSYALGGAGNSMGDLADATGDADTAARDYEGTLHRLIDGPLQLAEAERGLEEALDGLSESIATNGRNWDATTAKGRANSDAMQRAIEKAVGLRDAEVGMGTQVGVANAKLDAQIGKLREQVAVAGGDVAAFDRLTGALRNYLATPNVKVITTKFVTQGTAPRSGGPGQQFAFASGGDFKAGYAVVGEEGPELVKFNTSGHVYSHAESRRLAGSPSPAGGGPLLIRVRLEYPDGRVARDQIIDAAAARGQTPGGFLGV